MKKHEHQKNFLSDASRFKFLLTGRRGGKTYAIVEDILLNLPKCPYGGEIFYIGPTNQHAKELIWEPLEDRIDELKWKCRPMVSKSRIEFPGKRKIYITGAEKIRRIRGHKVFKAYLDELAYFEEDLGTVWRAVRPSLADFKGGAILSTTPDGKGSQAYDFYLETLKKEDWKYFHWKTIDNPYIDAEEIEAARRELDPKSFAQEYLAEWVSFEGLAYYCFEESLHIKKQPEVSLDQPVLLTLDFNVNPTTMLLAQRDGDIYRFKKEYSFKNSDTIATVTAFCEDFKEIKDKIRLKIYGDAAGDARKSNTGFSDYHYLKEILTVKGFSFEMCVPASNPSIVDRVAHSNSYLKNVYGNSRIEIDPSCNDLIKDLSSQTLEGRFPSKKFNIGHKADAFGYLICWEKTVGDRKKQGTIQL